MAASSLQSPRLPSLLTLPGRAFARHLRFASSQLRQQQACEEMNAPTNFCSLLHARLPLLCLSWSLLPAFLQPASFMPAARAARKEAQLANMIDAMRCALAHMGLLTPPPAVEAGDEPPRRRPLLVDFCAGSGHLAFPAAWLLPHCDVALLERNDAAIARAHQRLASMAACGAPLPNLRIIHSGLQEFDEPFDVGMGVHACGWLSDVIQLKCFEHRAAFVLAPCCVGKLKLGVDLLITTDAESATADAAQSPSASPLPSEQRNEAQANENDANEELGCPCSTAAMRLSYPRSAAYSSLLTPAEYLLLASRSDYSDESWDFTSAAARAGASLKSRLEWDRILAAREAGYVATMRHMRPITCTPKNDVLIGVHAERYRAMDEKAADEGVAKHT